MIYTVNERAAARTGSDIFKMTNKSSRAVKKLADVSDSEDRFSGFVDELYFLVYEGSGACKRLPKPPPAFALDVKFLRTQLRHDLDHGAESEAATKRQRGAAVLQKYLGTGTLRGASVGQLRAAHFRLLLGLRKLVKALLRNPTGAV